jgi:hypothetical protein
MCNSNVRNLSLVWRRDVQLTALGVYKKTSKKLPNEVQGVHARGIQNYMLIQSVPIPTKPDSSLIIPKPIKKLQRDLNSNTFVGEK